MYNIYFLSCPVSLNQIAQFHLLLHCLMMSKSCITCWMLVVPFVLYEDILKKYSYYNQNDHFSLCKASDSDWNM